MAVSLLTTLSVEENMRKAYLLVFLLLVSVSGCFGQGSPTAADSSNHCPVPRITATLPTEKVEAPEGTADLHSVIVSVEAAIKCYQANVGIGPDALPSL